MKEVIALLRNVTFFKYPKKENQRDVKNRLPWDQETVVGKLTHKNLNKQKLITAGKIRNMLSACAGNQFSRLPILTPIEKLRGYDGP